MTGSKWHTIVKGAHGPKEIEINMPISYYFDKENAVIYEYGAGKISTREFIDFREEVLKFPLVGNLKFFADYRLAKFTPSFNDMFTTKE